MNLHKSGTCVLGCNRKVATYSKTNICGSCLSNLSFWRRQTSAKRLHYRDTLTLRQNRQEEIEQYPKGYARLVGGRRNGKG